MGLPLFFQPLLDYFEDPKKENSSGKIVFRCKLCKKPYSTDSSTAQNLKLHLKVSLFEIDFYLIIDPSLIIEFGRFYLRLTSSISITCLSICLSTCQSVPLSICLSVCRSLCLYVCLSCLSVRPSISLSVYQSIRRRY